MSKPRRRPRVLVVSHEGSRTGAPRVALAVLEALPDAEWDRRVIVRWPGPLVAEFQATGARVALEPLRRPRALLRLWRRTRRLATRLEGVVAAMMVLAWRPDVIWCNTVLSASYVRPGLRRGTAVVLHVHESEEQIVQVLARYGLPAPETIPTLLLGCAPRVCTDVARAMQCRPDDVVLLLSVPDAGRVTAAAQAGSAGPKSARLVVGSCGLPSPAKGADLWLDVAERLTRMATAYDVEFVWVGGQEPATFREWSARTGLADRVSFKGSLENPYPEMAAFDVFFLPSRKDQFPLVVLEAMHLARPVVAFAVGDVAEQLGDTGILVPPLDVEAAAAGLDALLRDPDERMRLGEAARQRAMTVFSISDFNEKVESLARQAARYSRGTGDGIRAAALG